MTLREPPPERYPQLTVAALLASTETYGTLAELLRVTRRTLHRWARTGLTIEKADEWAHVLGVHPGELWPAWRELDAIRKRRDEAQRIAELRRSNPDYAERNRQYSRAYWEQHREALKAARRRRYVRNSEREKARERARRRDRAGESVNG